MRKNAKLPDLEVRGMERKWVVVLGFDRKSEALNFALHVAGSLVAVAGTKRRRLEPLSVKVMRAVESIGVVRPKK